MTETKQTSTALITDDKDRIKYALINPEALAELLAPMKAKVDEKGRTAETKKGRDEIRSLAYSMARDKRTVVKVGKDEVIAIKAEIKKYDACIKSAEETIEGYQHQVREPLTKWEDLRKKAEDAIDSMEEVGYEPGEGVRDIQASIKRLEDVEVGNFPEEMRVRACEVGREALARARETLAKVQKVNEETRELKQLRQDKIDSDAREERDRIAKAAADEATKKAEAKAAQDIIDANARAEKAERDKQAAVDKAKRDAELAEANRIDELARKEIEFERKVEQERLDRLAEEQRQHEEREARTRNMVHRADIQLEALGCMISETRLDSDICIKIVKAITDGKIKNVTMNF